jgi:hypothetical protein
LTGIVAVLRCGLRDVIDYIVADGDAMRGSVTAAKLVP